MSVKNGMKSSIQSRDVHLEDLIELREAQELHKRSTWKALVLQIRQPLLVPPGIKSIKSGECQLTDFFYISFLIFKICRAPSLEPPKGFAFN